MGPRRALEPPGSLHVERRRAPSTRDGDGDGTAMGTRRLQDGSRMAPSWWEGCECEHQESRAWSGNVNVNVTQRDHRHGAMGSEFSTG